MGNIKTLIEKPLVMNYDLTSMNLNFLLVPRLQWSEFMSRKLMLDACLREVLANSGLLFSRDCRISSERFKSDCFNGVNSVVASKISIDV